MVTTEINILEQIQISEELIESIKSAAKGNAEALYWLYEQGYKLFN